MRSLRASSRCPRTVRHRWSWFARDTKAKSAVGSPVPNDDNWAARERLALTGRYACAREPIGLQRCKVRATSLRSGSPIMSDLLKWLERLALGQYEAAFAENDIDFDA